MFFQVKSLQFFKYAGSLCGQEGVIKSLLYVTPHHQMRHKSQIPKLRFCHTVIEENTSFKDRHQWSGVILEKERYLWF